MSRHVFALAVLLSAVLLPTPADAANEEGPKLEVTPYLWASGITVK